MNAVLSPDAYTNAVARIEAIYRPPDFDADQGTEPQALAVCADGPGFLAEQSRGGELTWLSGSCASDRPNRALARLLTDLVADAAAAAWKPQAANSLR